MAEHNELGRWGEEIAAQYLEKNGWYIRHRDWRYGHIDIDLVAIDEAMSTLLIVEVKTRASEVSGLPDEAITFEKKNNIIRAAAAYIKSFAMQHLVVRYDTISVIGKPETGYRIEHKRNAFDVVANHIYHEKRQKKTRYGKRPGCW